MEEDNTALYIFIFIIFIAFIVLIIVVLVKNDTKRNDELTADNVEFRVVSITGSGTSQVGSIASNWTGTGNSNDILTLYASTGELTFNKNGEPTSNSGLTPLFYSSGAVKSSALIAQINGMTANLVYNLSLIVTNPDVTGYKEYKDTLHLSLQPVSGERFIITDLKQPGAITVIRPGSNSEVIYGPLSATRLNQEFVFGATGNTGGNLCLARSATQTTCLPGSTVLYNNAGVLSAAMSGTSNEPTSADSTWIYNGKNKWCLATGSNCMTLNPVGSGTTGTISVTSTGTQWLNEFSP